MKDKVATLEELGLNIDDVYETIEPTRWIDVTVGYELEILSTHIENLEKYEKEIQKVIAVQSNNEIKEEAKDQEDYEIISQKYRSIKDEIPRGLYNPIVVSLWGLLESTIMGYSNYLKREEKLVYGIKEVNGRDFISKSKKYFNSYVGLNLSYRNITDLRNIQKLRNYVAHTNGNIEFISKEEVIKVEKLVKEVEGVEIVFMSIVVSHQGLMTMNKTIKCFINELMESISHRYKREP